MRILNCVAISAAHSRYCLILIAAKFGGYISYNLRQPAGADLFDLYTAVMPWGISWLFDGGAENTRALVALLPKDYTVIWTLSTTTPYGRITKVNCSLSAAWMESMLAARMTLSTIPWNAGQYAAELRPSTE